MELLVDFDPIVREGRRIVNHEIFDSYRGIRRIRFSPKREKIEELDAFSRSRNSTIRSKHVVIEKTRKGSVSYDNVEFIRTVPSLVKVTSDQRRKRNARSARERFRTKVREINIKFIKNFF